ncbi:MAG: AI-2E family transporter [Gemmatimonadota bacterium]
MNFIESRLMTPLLLGRSLTLNPVVIFVGIMFCGRLWGIAGALLAVPLLVVTKVVCDHLGHWRRCVNSWVRDLRRCATQTRM